MFSSLLIANRGEIAVRIAATARRLGIDTVAVYSEADADALHVRRADRAVAIGPADPRLSYLDAERIVAAARETGAEAIHPGYGFLSENAAFAEACAAAGLVFVGPPAAAIRAMGSKSEAKAIMERAGVPVVPGYHGDRQDAAFLKRKAYEIGYPVLIKAVAGGGGKGMRRVDKALTFEDELAAAKREAATAFGDDRVLVERYVTRPRHIEIQVFADSHGRTVSLHERDCSVQRRHQKVVEEAPAPGMTAELRRAMGEAAVRAAEAVGYVGAGTVEFIAEGGEALAADRFYFMEMNTRLQVEHPVTEMVTGFDLVEWQLRVAAGEPLPLEGEPPAPKGHAIEVRLYAEDPDTGFLPSSGRLAALAFPEGVRVDTGFAQGDTVSASYDPLIAKLIVNGPDRGAAIETMAAALDGTSAIGPKTNLTFLRAVMGHDEFVAGTHDTGFVDRALDALTAGAVGPQAIADAAHALIAADEGDECRGTVASWRDPWGVSDGFRVSGRAERWVALTVDGEARRARVVESFGGLEVRLDGCVGRAGAGGVHLADGAAFAVEGGRAVRVTLVDEASRTLVEEESANRAVAPMHGRLVALFVTQGESVAAGASLFAIEAMKMEHTVKAVLPATVEAVHASVGDQVAEGARIIELRPVDTPETAVATAGEPGSAEAEDGAAVQDAAEVAASQATTPPAE